MELHLRLHVQLLQLVEDLLQVQPVFGQDEHRPVDGHEADARLALGLYIYVDDGAWPHFLLAEAHLYLVGIAGEMKSNGAAGPSCNQGPRDSRETSGPIPQDFKMNIPPWL